MRLKKLSLTIALCLLMQIALADDGDVVKGNEEISDHDNEVDQVALESEPEPQQQQPQKVHYQHNKQQQAQPQGPGPARTTFYVITGNNQGIPLALGQPFGPPPPPSQLAYQGPPPPLPPQRPPPAPVHVPQALPDLSVGASSTNEIWASPVQDMAKIISLDVKCEKNGMKVFVQFDKPFYGIVFSKGHYSNMNCVHLPSGLGRASATFDIGLHECGTSGNTENGLYGYGHESGSGTYFENIIVIQYDPQVQEVWDQARKLRCTWHDQYEKSVTFRPFPVDMLDVVRADFAGDNVGCWMQIQVGKGPWASEVSGLVKIGQTMTMVLAIKDDDSKFDMLVRNCVAHDGKRAPIQLVDQRGCVTRPKLMSRFTKIKNFGASASVLSYAHFQAFKFPDSMEVHFQCTIQICRYQCPDQCSDPNLQEVHHLQVGPESQYGPPPPQLHVDTYHVGSSIGKRRDERRVQRRARAVDPNEPQVGLNRIIKVVSSGDLTFAIDENANATASAAAQTMVFPAREDGLICMTTPGFAITLVILLGILVTSCLISAVLYIRLRPFSSISKKERAVAFTNPQLTGTLPVIQIPPPPPSHHGTLSKTRTHT
ncbi:transmembrane protein dusky isoform X1 [Musca autumnalis]|uniref:transmembrane protein dusky isoform X1 n=1 Tax=Musca autumnalis TaxID=221902 RepID=UPI003CF89389